MTTNDQPPVLEAFGAGYLRLYDALHNGDVQDAQWQASRKPVPVDDVNIRSRGLISDPTFHIYQDRGRQDLREAVKKAERAMREADAAMSHALAVLEAVHTEPSGASESETPS